MEKAIGLLEELLFEHVTADGTNYAGAANTTDLTSGVVDTANFEGVIFMVILGDQADTATLDIKIKQSNDSGGSPDDFSDVESSKIAIVAGASDTDHKFVLYQVHRPLKRYLELFFDRGTANSVIAAVVAIKYGPRVAPVTQKVTAGQMVSASTIKKLVSPAEGTA